MRGKTLTKAENKKIRSLLDEGVAPGIVAARTSRSIKTIYRIRRLYKPLKKTPTPPSETWVVFAVQEGAAPIVEAYTDKQTALNRAASYSAGGVPARLACEVAFEIVVSGRVKVL